VALAQSYRLSAGLANHCPTRSEQRWDELECSEKRERNGYSTEFDFDATDTGASSGG
jgi:hypothetical protein